MTAIADLLDAASFAADRHRNQRRKDADASPYINHPLEVAAGCLGSHMGLEASYARALEEARERVGG